MALPDRHKSTSSPTERVTRPTSSGVQRSMMQNKFKKFSVSAEAHICRFVNMVNPVLHYLPLVLLGGF